MKVLEQVTNALRERGVPATFEYPGFIQIGERAYGTANELWGWSTETGDPHGCGELPIASSSEDVDAIAAAIVESLPKGVRP